LCSPRCFVVASFGHPRRAAAHAREQPHAAAQDQEPGYGKGSLFMTLVVLDLSEKVSVRNVKN
jgi:hypothetical protein